MYNSEQQKVNKQSSSEEIGKNAKKSLDAKNKMSMKRLGIFFDRIEDTTPNYVLGYN